MKKTTFSSTLAKWTAPESWLRKSDVSCTTTGYERWRGISGSRPVPATPGLSNATTPARFAVPRRGQSTTPTTPLISGCGPHVLPRRPGFSNLRCQLHSGNSNDLLVLDDGGSENEWATRGLVSHGPVHHRESQSSLTRNRATGAQRDWSGPMRFRDLVAEIGE